jgi:tungstate transport system ATP-binding protein
MVDLYTLKNICHEYNDRPVLAIDHWQVAADAIVGLAGPNGSGKSTLLKLLGFIERPTRGEILIDGSPVEPRAGNLRTRITLLHQESYLLKRSVYGNIAYGLRVRAERSDERRRVRQALEWVGLDPAVFADRPWYALSGGEARRVALAARLVLKPNVFLLDEPTTSVDAASAQMIKDAIMRARSQWGTTLIISSHDLEWLNDICDHIVHLFRGRIMAGGQPTLVSGPWQSGSNGQTAKQLPDGQLILVRNVPPDMNTAVATIDSSQMVLDSLAERLPPTYCRLRGRLVRLGIEKAADRINATVVAGGLAFTIPIHAHRLTNIHIAPGEQVWIGYDPAAVTWLV